MKDSAKYAQEIQKLHRSLARKYPKPKKVEYDNLLEALVHALLLEHLSESATRAAFRRFGDHFVDFNDMRVSRPEEVVEMLGEDNETARIAASNVIKALTAIYHKNNHIDLESLKKSGKRQAKAALEKFDGISGFCVDYCTLTALAGHAVPLTAGMIEFLRNNGLVNPKADDNDIKGFLTRQVSATKAYEFYSLLRRESDSCKPSPSAKKTTQRQKTKPATAKKTTKKKTAKKK